MTETTVAETKNIVRTSLGLRDALFDELDALRFGKTTPQRASAMSKLAVQIINSVRIEIGSSDPCHVRCKRWRKGHAIGNAPAWKFCISMRQGLNIKYSHTFEELKEEFQKMRELRHLTEESYAGLADYSCKWVFDYVAKGDWMIPTETLYYDPSHALDVICQKYGFSCVVCGVVDEPLDDNEKRNNQRWTADLGWFFTGDRQHFKVLYRSCSLCEKCRNKLWLFKGRRLYKLHPNPEGISYALRSDLFGSIYLEWLMTLLTAQSKALMKTA